MRTNVKETSIIAYREINKTGKPLSQKERILNSMADLANYSLRELKRKVGGIEMPSICARVNSLKKEGKVLETKRRKCSISGKLITPVIRREGVL